MDINLDLAHNDCGSDAGTGYHYQGAVTNASPNGTSAGRATQIASHNELLEQLIAPSPFDSGLSVNGAL